MRYRNRNRRIDGPDMMILLIIIVCATIAVIK